MEYTGKVQDFIRELFKLDTNKIYKFTAKENKKKRSLNANSFYWVLLQELAEKLNLPKEEIYRQHIRELGAFISLHIQDNGLEEFLEKWSSNGIGWVCEVDNSKIDGCATVFAYYGSSTYDTKQMSRLIEQLIQDCHQLGILTPQDKEIERIIEEWSNRK